MARVADAIRAKGRGMLAQAVERLVPITITPNGGLTLGYDPLDDTFAQAAENSRADVLAAVQGILGGVSAVAFKPYTPTISDKPARDTTVRMTAHDVQRQRTEQIASRSPLLDAAVKALDLELLD